MDVIERIEQGVAGVEEAHAVRRLVAALIDALQLLSAQSMHAGVQPVMLSGLDALGKVLRHGGD